MNRWLDTGSDARTLPLLRTALLGLGRLPTFPFIEVEVVVLVVPPVAIAVAITVAITPLGAIRLNRLVGVVAPLAKVLRLDIADVKEAVAPNTKVDKGSLDARFQVDDPPLVDVADVIVLAVPLDVEFLELAIFDNPDAALLGLCHIDQHFLFHKSSRSCTKVKEAPSAEPLARGPHIARVARRTRPN